MKNELEKLFPNQIIDFNSLLDINENLSSELINRNFFFYENGKCYFKKDYLQLTYKEYLIMKILILHIGYGPVCPKLMYTFIDQKKPENADMSIIRKRIANIRKKIAKLDSGNYEYIINERGMGYMLVFPE